MARQRRNGEMVRVNLRISKNVRETLEGLQLRAEAESLSEVVRKALALLDLITEHHESGGRVLLESPDAERLEVLRIL